MRGANGITTIRVPEGRSEVIQRNLASGAELPSVNLTVRHRVRRGETLRSIAQQYAVSPVELARVNSLGRGRPLRRGAMLTVPSSMRAPKPEVIGPDTDDPRASTSYVPERQISSKVKIEGNSVPIERITHTVKRGETLAAIATKYGVTVTELKRWNRLTSNIVRTGTRLRIRSSSSEDTSATTTDAGGDDAVADADASGTDASNAEPPAPAPKRAAPRLHTVVRGETLTSIAARYGVTVGDLRKWNGIAVNATLEAGRVLEVSPDVVADARTLDAPAGGAAKARPLRVHVVKAGQTITEIAGLYNVSVEQLRKLNGLRTTRLLVGQKLKLPS